MQKPGTAKKLEKKDQTGSAKCTTKRTKTSKCAGLCRHYGQNPQMTCKSAGEFGDFADFPLLAGKDVQICPSFPRFAEFVQKDMHFCSSLGTGPAKCTCFGRVLTDFCQKTCIIACLGCMLLYFRPPALRGLWTFSLYGTIRHNFTYQLTVHIDIFRYKVHLFPEHGSQQQVTSR